MPSNSPLSSVRFALAAGMLCAGVLAPGCLEAGAASADAGLCGLCGTDGGTSKMDGSLSSHMDGTMMIMIGSDVGTSVDTGTGVDTSMPADTGTTDGTVSPDGTGGADGSGDSARPPADGAAPVESGTRDTGAPRETGTRDVEARDSGRDSGAPAIPNCANPSSSEVMTYNTCVACEAAHCASEVRGALSACSAYYACYETTDCSTALTVCFNDATSACDTAATTLSECSGCVGSCP